MNRRSFLLGSAAAAAGAHLAGASAGPPATVTLCCAPSNDLFRALRGVRRRRFDDPASAIVGAPAGGAVLLLADGYPDRPVSLSPEDLAAAKRRGLRLYVEFPGALPGLGLGPARLAQWQRAVVTSARFGADLPRLSLLAIHDCRYLPVEAPDADLSLARVAGYDTAIYGLPAHTDPLLFAYDGMLVATTKLSHFVTGRYAPEAAWRTVWLGILERLGVQAALRWRPTVRPCHAREARLPADAEAAAVRRGAGWYLRSGVIPSASIRERLEEWDRKSVNTLFVEPTPACGDGSLGMLEGINSQIRLDGRQPLNVARRGDCTGESALALALGGQPAIARNLLDYWFFTSVAQKGKRADPAHPAYGLIAWGISTYAWEKAFYGDDNARLILGAIGAAATLRESRWDEAILRCLLANLRTTGPGGFRADRIDIENLEAGGWRPYFETDRVSYSPHYQAYLWSCYLWAYRHTRYEPFFQRAEAAIRRTMAVYPDQWTGAMTMARARILLALAWLVRVSDTPEHRGWLRRIVDDMPWDPSGAAREELGRPGWDGYGPGLGSNDEYGARETPIVQRNGDPAADQLYANNFALLGLHEAAAATGDAHYRQLSDRLARFMCRIQVRSEAHPELDGAWFRGFDLRRWEYWASSGDAGWGVWCVETGWTQAWITATLAMRVRRTSLWDLTAGTRIGDHLAALRPAFLPD